MSSACVYVCSGRCEPKGALTGSNAGITSIDFDSAVSDFLLICSETFWLNVETNVRKGFFFFL